MKGLLMEQLLQGEEEGGNIIVPSALPVPPALRPMKL